MSSILNRIIGAIGMVGAIGVMAVSDTSRVLADSRAVVAAVKVQTREIPALGKRVFLDLLLENRSRNEIWLHRSLAYPRCQIIGRALHFFADDGTEVRYRGVLVSSGATNLGAMGEDRSQYEILRAGEKLEVRNLDISAAYEFPQEPRKLRAYWEAGGFQPTGGWVEMRSPDVWFDFVGIALKEKERPSNRVGKTSTARTTRTLWCEQSTGRF